MACNQTSKLSKTCKRLIQLTYKMGYDKIPDLSVDAARQIFSDEHKKNELQEVTLKTNSGNILANIFHPNPTNNKTLILYLHGGGYVFRNTLKNARFCERLSKETNTRILMPHYALSPEYKFPHAIEQIKNIIKGINSGNITPQGKDIEKIILCGESSGANLAIAAALSINADISGMILLSPSLDYSNDYASKIKYEHGMLLDKPVRSWFAEKYLNNYEERSDHRVSPAKLTDFKKINNCLIVASEFDPLYSESVYFYNKANGKINISFEEYPTIHGFMTLMIEPFFSIALSKIKAFLSKL